jgi:hypothetical protein
MDGLERIEASLTQAYDSVFNVIHLLETQTQYGPEVQQAMFLPHSIPISTFQFTFFSSIGNAPSVQWKTFIERKM